LNNSGIEAATIDGSLWPLRSMFWLISGCELALSFEQV
jgi:hypothetical protein